MASLQKTVRIPSDLCAAQRAEADLLDEVARFGYSDASCFAIKLALEEGINNAIKHGNKFDASKSIDLTYHIAPDRAAITIADEGPGFDPARLPDPTADENLEKPTGRGVMLMHAYMDEVWFNDKGNEVHMVKKNT